MRVLKLSVSIWVLVCVLLVAGVVIVVWYMRKKREFLRQRFFQQINRVRMENLRSRISPHFTFNVLGREINQFNGSEEVKHNLMELVKYLRRSLELTEKLSVSCKTNWISCIHTSNWNVGVSEKILSQQSRWRRV